MYGYQYLKNFLSEEGFKINEEDRFFTFKYQGSSYFSFKNESSFLQIVMICNTENYSRSKLLEVCNGMNSDKFVLKFVVNDETVWASYEFEPSSATTSNDYELILTLLENSTNEMFQKLQE